MNGPEDRPATTGQPALELGRAHYAAGRWGAALSVLRAVEADSGLAAEDLERLAWSAGLVGDDDTLLDALARLHQAQLGLDRWEQAAMAAFWSGFRLFALGEHARAAGWLARAERLVADRDCVARGYLLLPVAFRHITAQAWQPAREAASRAAELGARFQDADLTAFARNLHGRALIREGRAVEGLALLDEVLVQLTSGELSPMMTGLVYCSVIITCQRACALDRAREWTEALSKWCGRQPEELIFQGSCLVHRSEILELGGAWSDAIAEARRASRKLSPRSDPEALAEAHYRQAEILRLRGEHDDAEVAYRLASDHGREPQPGLALLRLAQGRGAAAAAAVRRVVDAATEVLDRARLLPACVEICLAVGEIETAREASAELDAIAERLETDIVTAMAAHARGAVLLAGGDARAACAPLRHAFLAWRDIGAPYIAARIRVLIGRACRALGDDDTAALELAAAREVFVELSAAPDLAALDRLKAPGASAAHGLTPREIQVLRLLATGKTNRAIASELGLSEKTVDRHTSNVFSKLDVSNRAAATAFAYRHALI